MYSTDQLLAVDRTDARTPGRAISRYSWIALLFLWLIYALNANSRQMIFYVLPSITDEFGTSPSEIGAIAGAVTAATGLFAIPAMVWADRGGRGWKRKYRHLPIVIGYALLTFLTGVNILTITLAGLACPPIDLTRGLPAREKRSRSPPPPSGGLLSAVGSRSGYTTRLSRGAP